MTVKNVKNKAASVHQRLLNMAKKSNRPFNELLHYFAMERFLYRLSVSPHRNRFVLKGALMLTVWEAPQTRPTMDIDLLGYTKNSQENIESIFKEVCTTDVSDDGLSFEADSIITGKIKEDADYEGIRVQYSGHLGSARISMQIDISFGDVVNPRPRKIVYPTMLNDPAPMIKAYNRENTVAEKFDAMVKLGELNTRMKDFFDLWFLSRHFEFDGVALLTACRHTFEHRHTEMDPNPIVLTERFADDSKRQTMWTGFLRKSRIDFAPPNFKDVMMSIQVFILPIAWHMASGDTFDRHWLPAGTWIEKPR